MARACSGCLWAGSVDARGRMKNGDHKQEERDAVHSQSSHAVQPFGVQDTLVEYKYPALHMRGAAYHSRRFLATKGSSKQLAFMYSDSSKLRRSKWVF